MEVEENEGNLPAVQEAREIAPAPELGAPVGRLTMKLKDEAIAQAVLFRELAMGMIKTTRPAQWHDLDGNPYLKDSGIQVIAGAIGLRFQAPKIEREDGEDKRGKWTRFKVELSARWLQETFYDVGSASTRDPFFGRKRGADVPYEDIDLGDVEKKAVTNARHRILVRALGIQDLTWEELWEIAKIKRPAEGTRYKGNEQRRTTGAGAWTKEKERIQGILLELAGGDTEGAANRLEALTENTEKGYRGWRDPAQLPDWMTKRILPKLEAELSKWVDQRNAAPEEGPPPAAAAKAPAAAPAKPKAREPGEEG